MYKEIQKGMQIQFVSGLWQYEASIGLLELLVQKAAKNKEDSSITFNTKTLNTQIKFLPALLL